MEIRLAPETITQMRASIKRYAAEALDEEMGDLKAGLMLEFILKELGPSIYNQAIADAQAYLQARVADLEGICYVDEFGYWPANQRRR